jgi:glycosyltransferase involved in cell wall biosynthesis
MQILDKQFPPLLTAIIPVSNPRERLKFITSWTKTLKPDLPIDFIFVLDSASESEKKDFKGFVGSLVRNNFTLIEINAGSPGSSRNAGLSNVKTKWVCFWDSDDFPYPETILTTLSQLEEQADVVIGNYATFVYESDLKQTAISCDQKVLDIFTRNPGIWRVVFSAELIENERFLNYLMGEDQLFLVKLGLNELRCIFSSKVFYGYVQHDMARLTNSTSAFCDVLLVQKELINLIHRQNGQNRLMTTIVLVRVSFSGLIRLNWFGKSVLIKNFIFFLSQPKNFLYTIRAITKWMRNR